MRLARRKSGASHGYASAGQRSGHVVDRGDLRHADARDDAGGADGARADADLHRVGAGLDQRARGVAGGDVAADHVHRRIVLLDPAHALDHALAVAVRGVDHDHVHARVHQRLDALLGALAHPDGGAHAQPPAGVAAAVPADVEFAVD